jgi:hypothetical protein
VLPPDPATNGHGDDVELVDAVLVPARGDQHDAIPALGGTATRQVVRRRPGVVAAQAAAVVPTGFVAGARATAVVAPMVGAVRRARDARRLPPVIGSRRFLVDVHLLGDR